MRPNEISENASELTYLKKVPDEDTSVYDIVLNTLKKLYKSHNPMMQKMHKTVIQEHYTVT